MSESAVVKKMKLTDLKGQSDPISQDENLNVEIQDDSQIVSNEDNPEESMMIEYSQDEDDIKTNTPTPDNLGFQILSSEMIFENMIAIVEQVKLVIPNLPDSSIMTLLNHVKWDEYILVETYFEDPDKLLKDAQVIVPLDDGEVETIDPKSALISSHSSDTIDCSICYWSVQLDQSTAASCGHSFCNHCWKSYLKGEVMDNGQSQMITCPENDCSIFIGYEMIRNLLRNEPTTIQKYQQLISGHFVASNPHFRWCPSAGCGNVVMVKEVEWKSAGVTCSCGQNFCFLCGKDWHPPIKCDLLVRWLKKCLAEPGYSLWIQKNTKDCPKCKTMIEKNGGCNMMVCTNKGCGHAFCWICMQDHPYGYCNKDEVSNSPGGEMSDTRAEFKRFTHYLNRYLIHEESLKFESKLKEAAGEKMSLFQNDWNMSWADVQFFNVAAETLCRCRKTLQYTYAYAYFLEKTNQQEIFENNQRDLESATETLSQYLENELIPDRNDDRDRIDPVATKLKIVDSGAYCETRRTVLINHVQDGYDEDFWTYRSDETLGI